MVSPRGELQLAKISNLADAHGQGFMGEPYLQVEKVALVRNYQISPSGILE
jgi:hypothetical protein